MIIAASAAMVTKKIRNQRNRFFDENIEVLMNNELEKPICIVENITPDNYTCDPGGRQVCFSNENS